jgi:hypothetical protein
MKKPTPNESGLAISESLYSFDKSNETDSKLVNPTDTINLFGRPSIIPGVEYPISDREEELLNKGYDKGQKDALRMNRTGHLVEVDPFLKVLRERVEQIREEKIKSGDIEPANKKERKMRLGL